MVGEAVAAERPDVVLMDLDMQSASDHERDILAEIAVGLANPDSGRNDGRRG